MTTDFEELFDDVMKYVKKNSAYPDFKGGTREDLEKYIRDIDPQKHIKHWVREELLDTGKAERLIEEGIPTAEKPVKDTIRDKAIKTELRRQEKIRLRDEAKTAKDTRPITNPNYKRWLKNPGRMDLRGIDTASHNLIRGEINKRLRAAKAKGFKVGMKGAHPYRKEKGETRRSLLNGRFMKRR